jgi:hypothetical protein
VLALVVVPHAGELVEVYKSCDVDALITRAGEPLDLFILVLKAEVRPFLDECLPLIGRIQNDLLLWRDYWPLQSFVGVQDAGLHGVGMSARASVGGIFRSTQNLYADCVTYDVVPVEGLEPPLLAERDFESRASTVPPHGHGSIYSCGGPSAQNEIDGVPSPIPLPFSNAYICANAMSGARGVRP